MALRGVLIGYSRSGPGGIVGTPLTVWLASRSRRSGRSAGDPPRRSRSALVCLASLVVLELGSAAWRGLDAPIPDTADAFDKPSAPDEYRIVVLGGSSALGEPYRPWLSVGQIVAWQLQQAVPDRRFECEILAWLGESLEKQHHKLAGLKHRPDAMIIYSGHNEFAARFEEERDPGSTRSPATDILRGPVSRHPDLALLPAGLRDDQQEPAGQPAAARGPPPAHRSAAVQPVGVGRHPGRFPQPAGGDRRDTATGSAPCRS